MTNLGHLAKSSSTSETLQKYRNQILNAILRALLVLGGITIAFIGVSIYLEGRAHLLWVYGTVYGFLAIITFKRAWGYRLRASLLLFFLLSLSLVGFSQVGLSSSGVLFLVAFNVLATIFFDLRGGIIALAISLITFSLFGWLAIYHSVEFPLQLPATAHAAIWLQAGLILFLLSATLSLSIGHLTHQLELELTKSDLDATTQKKADLERQRLLEAEREQRQFAEALQDITIALNSTLSLDELVNRIIANIARVVPHDTVDIVLIEKQSVLRIVGSRGYPEQGCIAPPNMTLVLDDIPNLAQIAISGQPKILEDVWQDPNWVAMPHTNWIRAYLGAPIRLQGQEVIGFINLAKAEPGFFTGQHAARMLAFADQASIALSNIRRLDAERQQREFTEALRQASLALNGTLELDTLLDRLLDHVAGIVPYDAANIMLTQQDWIYVARQRGYDKFGAASVADIAGLSLKIDDTPNLRRMAETGQPLLINNTTADDNWIKTATFDYVKSWAGAPIMAQNRVIAFFSLDKIEPDFYTTEHQERLSIFAGQTALAMENARLFAETRRRADELEVLRRITQDLTALRDPDTLLQYIAEQVVQLLDGSAGGIFVYRSETRLLHLTAVGGEAVSIFGQTQHPGEGLVGQVWLTHQTMIINDYINWPERTCTLAETIPQAAIGTPIHWGDEFLGVMVVCITTGQRLFNQEDGLLLAQFADQAAVAIENARLYKQVQQHAADMEIRVTQRTVELQTLYELAQALGQVNQFDELFGTVLKHLQQATGCEVAAGLLVLDNKPTILVQGRGRLPAQVEAQLQTALLTSYTQARGQAPDEAEFEIKYLPPPDNSAHALPVSVALNAMLQAPIAIGAATIGGLLIANQNAAPFSEEHQRLLYTIADQTAETTGRLQLLLAAEHRRLESLVANLPNGLLLLDNELRLILTNDMAKHRLLPLIKTEIGDKLMALDQYPIETILAASEKDTPFVLETSEEPSQIYEIDAYPVKQGPETGGWTLLIRNVTEERALQKRIQEQERLAAVGQLAAGIAHDFNNILTGIIGFAELILLNQALPEPVISDVERIARQGHRAAHLVRQILDFSRQTISAKKPVDLAPFLKETIKLLERTLPEDIHIELDLEPYDYAAVADITQLQQALTNLAVNARDAMPSGGTLRFRLAPMLLTEDAVAPNPEMTPGEWIVLQIADTGTGIAPEIQDQIFEPFFTTKEIGKGTGLGLAQVYGIVKQHEGFIEVKSAPLSGTTFSIYLPNHTNPKAADYEEEEGTDIPLGDQELILLVEDDKAVLQVGKTMLTHLGYRVLTATNGREALEIFRQRRQEICLVLTDMTMPLMGGAELTAALRQQNPQARVIALTGYPLEIQDKELLAQGIITWLQKPLSLKKLARAIHDSRHIGLDGRELAAKDTEL